MPYEGQTGTAPDGTRVVYRKGRVYPIEQDPARGGGAPADAKTDLGYINDAKDQGNQLLDSATQMERFLALNRKLPTGPGMGFKLPFLPSAGDALVSPFSPTYQKMQAITAHLTPRERVAGSGATSDYENRLFRQAVPSVDKYGTANETIYEAKKQDAVKAKARAAFLDRYYAKAGTLSGAESAFDTFWRGYSSAGSGGPGGAAGMTDDDIRKALGL